MAEFYETAIIIWHFRYMMNNFIFVNKKVFFFFLRIKFISPCMCDTYS